MSISNTMSNQSSGKLSHIDLSQNNYDNQNWSLRSRLGTINQRLDEPSANTNPSLLSSHNATTTNRYQNQVNKNFDVTVNKFKQLDSERTNLRHAISHNISCLQILSSQKPQGVDEMLKKMLEVLNKQDTDETTALTKATFDQKNSLIKFGNVSFEIYEVSSTKINDSQASQLQGSSIEPQYDFSQLQDNLSPKYQLRMIGTPKDIETIFDNAKTKLKVDGNNMFKIEGTEILMPVHPNQAQKAVLSDKMIAFDLDSLSTTAKYIPSCSDLGADLVNQLVYLQGTVVFTPQKLSFTQPLDLKSEHNKTKTKANDLIEKIESFRSDSTYTENFEATFKGIPKLEYKNFFNLQDLQLLLHLLLTQQQILNQELLSESIFVAQNSSLQSSEPLIKALTNFARIMNEKTEIQGQDRYFVLQDCLEKEGLDVSLARSIMNSNFSTNSFKL